MGKEPESNRSPVPPARLYVNDLTVDFSLAEFTLDFAQRYRGSGGEVQSRLVTSPVNMVEFQRAIDTAIDSYDRRYGPIPRQGPAEEAE